MKTGLVAAENGVEYRRHRCPHCGWEWLEQCDTTDYPSHCPGCGDDYDYRDGGRKLAMKTRHFTTTERMAEIANNAIDAYGELLNGRALYDALTGSLKMDDEEILAAGFATLKEFMTDQQGGNR